MSEHQSLLAKAMDDIYYSIWTGKQCGDAFVKDFKLFEDIIIELVVNIYVQDLTEDDCMAIIDEYEVSDKLSEQEEDEGNPAYCLLTSQIIAEEIDIDALYEAHKEHHGF